MHQVALGTPPDSSPLHSMQIGSGIEAVIRSCGLCCGIRERCYERG